MVLTPPYRVAAAITALVLLVGAGGCVRRTLVIESEPAGALVWLNDREVGRTPVEIDFQHYGTYDVRLALDGYEPRSTSGDAAAPWWDVLGPDLIAEMLPADLESRIVWHYDLVPIDPSRDALVDRARALRERTLEGAEDEPAEAPTPEAAADEPGDVEVDTDSSGAPRTAPGGDSP